MKKYLLLYFLIIIPICALSQNKHLSFMGIPITGSIYQFEQRLITKGFMPRPEVNKKLPVGEKTYSGTYMGYNVDYITVYYSINTKNVYKVMVVFGSESPILIDKIENLFIERAKKKYMYCSLNFKPDDYSADYRFYIHSVENIELFDWSNVIGTIEVFQKTYWRQPSSLNHKFDSEKATKYYILDIDFSDRVNTKKNEAEVIDDL